MVYKKPGFYGVYLCGEDISVEEFEEKVNPVIKAIMDRMNCGKPTGHIGVHSYDVRDDIDNSTVIAHRYVTLMTVDVNNDKVSFGSYDVKCDGSGNMLEKPLSALEEIASEFGMEALVIK